MTKDHSFIREMSKQESPFRTGPQRSAQIIVVATVISALCLIQFEELNLGLPIVASLLLAGLIFKQGWLIYLMFASLIFLKIDNTALGLGFELAVLTWPDVFFTLVTMVLAALCMKYLELTKFIQTYYPTFRFSAPQQDKANQPIQSLLQFPSLLGGRWLLIPASTLISIVLLSVFPFDRQTARRMAITPEGTRLIFLAFFLFICWFSSSTIVSILSRWSMDTDQAGIQARSLIAKEFWNDSYSIEQRRAKFRRQNDES